MAFFYTYSENTSIELRCYHRLRSLGNLNPTLSPMADLKTATRIAFDRSDLHLPIRDLDTILSILYVLQINGDQLYDVQVEESRCSTHLVCRPPAGTRLRDVISGDIKWILISNYMVDFRWLLSSCPDLAKAEKVVLVHGEKSPEL